MSKNQPECVTNQDGSKEWFLNGKRHREDGPAIEYSNGPKFWYLNDKLHREDGPATEWADGTKEWYLNGKKITFGFKRKNPKVKALQELMKTQEVLEL